MNNVNWANEWLRPTVHDVVCAYMSMPHMGEELLEESSGTTPSGGSPDGEPDSDELDGADALDEEWRQTST